MTDETVFCFKNYRAVAYDGLVGNKGRGIVTRENFVGLARQRGEGFSEATVIGD
jgi:hypothetical protein